MKQHDARSTTPHTTISRGTKPHVFTTHPRNCTQPTQRPRTRRPASIQSGVYANSYTHSPAQQHDCNAACKPRQPQTTCHSHCWRSVAWVTAAARRQPLVKQWFQLPLPAPLSLLVPARHTLFVQQVLSLTAAGLQLPHHTRSASTAWPTTTHVGLPEP